VNSCRLQHLQGNPSRRRLRRKQLPVRTPIKLPSKRRHTSPTSHWSVSASAINISAAANFRRWSSICRGAAMWGLEHSEHTPTARKTVSTRLARYSYGMAISTPFDPKIHLMEDRILDQSEGIFRANNQMKWLLKRVIRAVAPDLV
jgi:hypothetical protein